VRLAAVLIAPVSLLVGASTRQPAPGWTQEELATLRSLSLATLESLPPDPSNRYADDSAAASLGKQLFFDPRFSGNGRVSCASCHIPQHGFQDGRPVGKGMGTGSRRTMPIAGTAYSPWFFWDGRSDSQWSQALGPLENPVEHGGDRLQYARLVSTYYRKGYARVFGAVPDLSGLPNHAGPVADSVRRLAWSRIAPVRQDEISRVYANIGKSIAAYERRIRVAPSRFDRYVAAELAGRPHRGSDSLTAEQVAGLRLFIGKANCSTCHNGSLFTDDHFHNIGVPPRAGAIAPDSGRTVGVRQAMASEFNCLGKYSDAKPGDCGEIRFAVTEGPELVAAYKTPSLRDVSSRAPYMHAGQFQSMSELLDHYNRAPAATVGTSELKPLGLSARELREIASFLETLASRGPTAGSGADHQ
jgi:cytochrome c peroxidase